MITDAAEAAAQIRHESHVALCAFGPSGGPKAVPAELAKSQGSYNFLASASTSLDDLLLPVMAYRAPYIGQPKTRAAINDGKVDFFQMHLAEMPRQLDYLGIAPDWAIVEVCQIAQYDDPRYAGKMFLTLTTSVGHTDWFLARAKNIIIEVNAAQPKSLAGFHRLTPTSTSIMVPTHKVKAIVQTNLPDTPATAFHDKDPRIGENVVDFLKNEVSTGRLGPHLLPYELGVGAATNSVGHALLKSGFTCLSTKSEVIQDNVLDLIDAGVLSLASAAGLALTEPYQKRFFADIARYKKNITLKPLSVTNDMSRIMSDRIIAINGCLEASVCGDVNSSSTNFGEHLMNGVGGSGEFARAASIAIFVLPSRNKGRSNLRLRLDHVDHPALDCDVLVTEHGYADIRFLAPHRAARRIISNCAHPDDKAMLLEGLGAGGYRPC